MKLLALHFIFHRPCEEIISLLETALQGAGLRVERTFDLRQALAGSTRCADPGNDTDERQYMVLLVYGASDKPATLVAHGEENRSWVEMINNSQHKPDTVLQVAISQTLRQLTLNSQAESTEEY